MVLHILQLLLQLLHILTRLVGAPVVHHWPTVLVARGRWRGRGRRGAAAAHDEGNHLVDGRAALHALLHEGAAALARAHVAARLEEYA